MEETERIQEGIYPCLINGKEFNQHVVLNWGGVWYMIPDFVLAEIEFDFSVKAVDEIKAWLEPQMHTMEAYKMYQ